MLISQKKLFLTKFRCIAPLTMTLCGHKPIRCTFFLSFFLSKLAFLPERRRFLTEYIPETLGISWDTLYGTVTTPLSLTLKNLNSISFWRDYYMHVHNVCRFQIQATDKMSKYLLMKKNYIIIETSGDPQLKN